MGVRRMSPELTRKRRVLAGLRRWIERDPDRLCDKALIAVGFLPQ
jgi:hypothetical protein